MDFGTSRGRSVEGQTKAGASTRRTSLGAPEKENIGMYLCWHLGLSNFQGLIASGNI